MTEQLQKWQNPNHVRDCTENEQSICLCSKEEKDAMYYALIAWFM